MAEESNADVTPRALMPLCSVFRRFLRNQGLKYTVERADVLQAIIDHDGPFEAEELLLEMRHRGHRVSKATIYRTLRLLQEAGIITQALFDSKQSHFQLIYGKEPRDVRPASQPLWRRVVCPALCGELSSRLLWHKAAQLGKAPAKLAPHRTARHRTAPHHTAPHPCLCVVW